MAKQLGVRVFQQCLELRRIEVIKDTGLFFPLGLVVKCMHGVQRFLGVQAMRYQVVAGG